MEILTKRLKLRLIEWTDLEAIHELHSLPEIDEFNTLGIPENIAITKSVIEAGIAAHQLEVIKSYTFAIETKSNNQLIGLFGLNLGSEKYKSAEVWYKLHSDHWKQGYATESLKAILNFGFETLHLHRIEAGCAVENIGSIKVLEKVGMIREGRKRKTLPLKSGWTDNFEYAILETDQRSK